MTKLIKLLLKLSRLFGKKRSEKQLFDINPKTREQLKEKFGVKNTNEFGDFSAKAKENREKIKKILDAAKKNPDQL